MKSRKVQAFYSQKARFYQRFFVGFLQWENVLAAFFKANDYLHAHVNNPPLKQGACNYALPQFEG